MVPIATKPITFEDDKIMNKFFTNYGNFQL